MWKLDCPCVCCLSDRGCKPVQWPVPAAGHMRVWTPQQATLPCTPQWQVSRWQVTMRSSTIYEQLQCWLCR